MSRGVSVHLSSNEAMRVVRAVVSISGLSEEALLHLRDPVAARWRWATMAVFRRAGYSYPQIGAAFGRDHSSVLGGVRNIEATDSRVVDEIAARVEVKSVLVAEDGSSPAMARAIAVSRDPCLRAAGDALGAVLAAAADVYSAGDVPSWRRMEAAAERLLIVARGALALVKEGT